MAARTLHSVSPKLSPATKVLLGLTLFRLLYLPLFCSVTDLAGDESYYWEWGRHLDWGYYSKPPLIGWLMGLVGWITGHAEWGIRLASLLCGTAALYFLQSLARRMFGERASFLATLLIALTPANTALNLFFTIDAPLVLFWSAALLALWRCIESPDHASRWLLLALSMGFGNLAKQMMLVFPVLMLLLFALTRDLRPLLRRPGLWMALAGSLLFMAPVLWWQQKHGWVTLGHMSHHFDTSAKTSVMDWLGRFLSFPASQAGLFTPVTWVLLIISAFTSLRRWHELELRQRVLTIFSAPALLVFFGLAMRQSVNPNWPAVFYLSAMVLLAGHLAQALEANQKQKLTRLSLGVGAAMTLLAYAAPLALPAVGLAGHPKLDPFERLRGWSEAGMEAGQRLSATPRPEQTFLLALGHRDNASQLAFYIPQHPPAYRWQPDGIIASQYELWPSMQEHAGWDALILQPSDKPLTKSLVRQFSTVEKLKDISVPLGKYEGRKWQVFLGHTLRAIPKADQAQKLELGTSLPPVE